MKRRDCFASIESLEKMCYAGKAATSYYFKVCQDNPGVLGRLSFRPRDIRDCHEDLESTYTVRVFAEFESQLRGCWRDYFNRQKRTPTEVLVDRVADRCSMPVAVVNNVHVVREYRNTLIHGGSGVPLTLTDARKYLLKYLGDLPKDWLFRSYLSDVNELIFS